MCEFFDNIPLDDEEKLSEERINNIKTSVLSRVKEEKAMSKRSTIRTITIAVAAAATAALSSMIASAELASAPVAAIEEVHEKPGEAAFKEYIEKAKAEDEGTYKEAPETVNGWTICTDTEDYICIQPSDNPDVYYIYYDLSNDDLLEKINNGWTLIDEDINVIHENEVPKAE